MRSVLRAIVDALVRPLRYLARRIRATDEAREQQWEHFRSQVTEWLGAAAVRDNQLLQRSLAVELAAVQAEMRARTPDSPACHGYKVYSQADEDGILADILSRLDGAPRTVIEIGCGDGTENNSAYLAVQGYRVCWCDASTANVAAIARGLGGLEFPRLLVVRRFLDTDNVKGFIGECLAFLKTTDLTVLSVDIDGNDLPVTLGALTACRPRVLCVEYNAVFPPSVSLLMAYNPTHQWQLDDYQGASLLAWCNALPEYRLVACSASGVNAFFVRRDLAGAFVEYPVAALYEPPRHRLIGLRAGHRPSLKWVRQAVTASS
jgi:hypothetical protein